MRDLSGKRVLVTGGARGIGLALARAFAAEGARIALADLDEAQLAVARRAIGDTTRTYPLDVTDTGAIAGIRERMNAEDGPIDVLVNNAGVVFGGAFSKVGLERHLLTLRVNAIGPVAMTHAFLEDLIARPEAHLVNVASASGFIGLPYGASYAASKWAVIGLSESLRQELREQGHTHVGVTTVCPGYVKTGLFRGARPPRTSEMVTPERVAARVVQAVKRDRPFVLVPWLVKITPLVMGALPTWLSDRISRVLGVTSGMQDWRGR